MAKNKSKEPVSGDQTPEWQKAQQKETAAKDSEAHLTPKDGAKPVKIKMKTDYMDVAKKGDTWTTDAEKAAELVRLDRAEYVK